MDIVLVVYPLWKDEATFSDTSDRSTWFIRDSALSVSNLYQLNPFALMPELPMWQPYITAKRLNNEALAQARNIFICYLR